MNIGLESKTLIHSEQWRQFLGSTAAALQIGLDFFVSGSEEHISVCERCPVCGMALPAVTSSSLSKLGEFDGQPFMMDPNNENVWLFRVLHLNEKYAVMARSYPCGHVDLGFTLHEKVCIANDLLCSFLVILTDQWNKEQDATELAALRKINHVVLSLLREENNALEHVLDLILSAAVILLDAGGSWLEYYTSDQQHVLSKGCCTDGTLTGIKDSITAEVNSPSIHGTFGIVAPAHTESTSSLLRYMVQECIIVFEIDSLLKLMESKISLITGSIDSLILLVDKRKKICFANRFAAVFLKKPIHVLIGLSVLEIEAPWCDAIASETSKLSKGIKDRYAVNDEFIFVDWEVYPLTGSEDIPGWLVMASDCTNYYRLQEMGVKIEKIVNTSHMLNVMAHEIRNPLATLKGLLQLINTKSRTPDTGKYIDIGLAEIKRLTLLLDDFMLLGKTASLKMETVDLKPFIEDTLTLLKMEFSDDQFEIIDFLSAVPPVLMDKQQMTQVMINLVKNSYEAMNRKGRISIHLTQLNSNSVEIRLSDTGPGIPDYVKDKLFQPYYSTKPTGTGLGLTITHTIIQNHEGSIHVLNNPEGGARFSIILPTCTEIRTEMAHHADILLVTDDDMIRLPAERVLRAGNLNAVSINRQESLFTVIERTKPSVVFIDDHLLNERILHNLVYCISAEYPDVRFLLTCEILNKDRAQNVYFIPKPINYAQLVNRIMSILDDRKFSTI